LASRERGDELVAAHIWMMLSRNAMFFLICALSILHFLYLSTPLPSSPPPDPPLTLISWSVSYLLKGDLEFFRVFHEEELHHRIASVSVFSKQVSSVD
jgi:hypothetical protein